MVIEELNRGVVGENLRDEENDIIRLALISSLVLVPLSCKCERIEVLAEKLRWCVVYIVTHERITQDFPDAGKLLQLSIMPARVANSQIEKIQ